MSRIRIILSVLIGLFSVCPAAQPVPRDTGLEIKGMLFPIRRETRGTRRTLTQRDFEDEVAGTVQVGSRGRDV